MDQHVTEILTQISAQAVTYISYLGGGNGGQCKANNVTKIMFIRQLQLKQKHSKNTGTVM
jgi:hypothetical protein